MSVGQQILEISHQLAPAEYAADVLEDSGEISLVEWKKRIESKNDEEQEELCSHATCKMNPICRVPSFPSRCGM